MQTGPGVAGRICEYLSQKKRGGVLRPPAASSRRTGHPASPTPTGALSQTPTTAHPETARRDI